jgi:YfiR/HmsC-like
VRTRNRPLWQALICLWLAAAAAAYAASAGDEYDVKASYLLNLVHFTDWPDAAFDSPGAPIRVCVAAPDPFGAALKHGLRGDRVGNRTIVLAHPASPLEIRHCQVLYVPAQARPSETAWLKAAGSVPVLTVGESSRFETGGGMVTFVTDNGQVRLDINRTAAERVHVRLSARVLETARRVF